MKRIKPIIIGILVLSYAIYGFYTGQLYVPGRYTGGSYVAGDRLLFIFLCYFCVAIVAFLWALPTKIIKLDLNEITKNPQNIEALMNETTKKYFLTPKFIAIFVFMGLAVAFLMGSLLFQNG